MPDVLYVVTTQGRNKQAIERAGFDTQAEADDYVWFCQQLSEKGVTFSVQPISCPEAPDATLP